MFIALFGQEPGSGNVNASMWYLLLKLDTNDDQFLTTPFDLSGAASTSVEMAALIADAVFVIRAF
jgi:hypothetical protein